MSTHNSKQKIIQVDIIDNKNDDVDHIEVRKKLRGLSSFTNDHPDDYVQIKDIEGYQDSVLPVGEKGDIYVVTENGTNSISTAKLVTEGTFVDNPEDLASALSVIVSNATIFNSFDRSSHGGSAGVNPALSNDIPGIPDNTNAWIYDEVNDIVKCTENTQSYATFTDPTPTTSYTASLKLGASGDDDDFISIVIARVKVEPKVPNNAYGLDPELYPHINTTDLEVFNEYDISLVRGRTDQALFRVEGQICRYALIYNFRKSDQKVLANGDDLVWSPISPNTNFGAGQYCHAEVTKTSDYVRCRVTNWTDAPDGEGALDHELLVSLDSDPLLLKFTGPVFPGYGALSQQNAYFTEIVSTTSPNQIYDLAGGDVYTIVDGEYVVDASRNLFEEFANRIVLNPATGKFFWVKSDGTYYPWSGSGGNVQPEPERIPFDWDISPVNTIDMALLGRHQYGNDPRIEVWLNIDSETEEVYNPGRCQKIKVAGSLSTISFPDMDLEFASSKTGYFLIAK